MSGSYGLFQTGHLMTLITIAIRVLVGIVVAMAVYRNAASRQAREYGIPAIVWAGLAFVEPALGLFVYWFVHRAQSHATA